jgi:putative membrane protein
MTSPDPQSSPEVLSLELSSRRTGLSFQRTRLSAERTLMSVERTSLSLIGFGFTIAQFFNQLRQSGTLPHETRSPRDFGVALIALGIASLLLGIVSHVKFMLGVRAERQQLIGDRLIHGESAYPVSISLIVAVLLLGIGLLAIASVALSVGPFH